MEFMLTYGWAILVVLVVIAALSYFGILNPARALPDRCNFQAGIHCRDYTLSSEEINLDIAGWTIERKKDSPPAYPLVLDLVNHMGETLHVTKITVAGDELECMYLQYEECPSNSVSFMNDADIDLGNQKINVNFSKPCFSVVEFCGTNDIYCNALGMPPAKELITWRDGETLKQGLGSYSEEYLAIPCTKIPKKGHKTDAVIRIEYIKKDPVFDEILGGYHLYPSHLRHQIYGVLKATTT